MRRFFNHVFLEGKQADYGMIVVVMATLNTLGRGKEKPKEEGVCDNR